MSSDCTNNNIYIEPINRVFKITLIGDSGVGKSSFLERYISGTYYDSFTPTIGVDFKCKYFTNYTNQTNQTTNIKLQIWDTAGQEKFKTISTAYYRKVHCFVLFFDLTNTTSFTNLNTWMKEINRAATMKSLFIVIGTKKDLKKDRKIKSEDIEKYCTTNNCMYFEVSTKNNDGINVIFDHIIESLFEMFPYELTTTPIPTPKEKTYFYC